MSCCFLYNKLDISHSHVLNIDNKKISSINDVKFLGVTIANKLTFKKHIIELCRNVSCKLCALPQITPFLLTAKAKLLANASIKFNFFNAPQMRMFAGKGLIKKICKIHSSKSFLFMINCITRYILLVMKSLYIRNTFTFWQQRSVKL